MNIKRVIAMLSLVLCIIGVYLCTSYALNKAEKEEETVMVSAEVDNKIIPPVEPNEYLGEYDITYYCPCEICCGKWSNVDSPITASGEPAVEGVTIACSSDIEFGTKLHLEFENGAECDLICQDRGGAIQGKKIDIYVASHEQALKLGRTTAKVSIVNENL